MSKGLIPQSDIDTIRERIAIEEVIGEYVELRPAGSSLKGLSPFKDEKTPSFTVQPSKGFYYCFSTSQGGDVFKFLMEMEHISFPEAVENCADRIGYRINYQGGGTKKRNEGPSRKRLVEANRYAHEFYRQQLETPAAETARQFILQRGFSKELIYHFELGYAPEGWDTLTKHLMKLGFSFPELETAGLSTMGKRGPIDRFHRRLLWPIKAVTGEVIGFGARKLFDDDKLGKYMNTPETPLYKKSKVLFGLDLARKEIANQHQVVVVEGYTDVMAMHAAGVTTAVAACGTAFGAEHLAILRRYMAEGEFLRGEIIYTFDGDEAGQKAAMRAYEGSPDFAGSSFVAVAPDGLDPCDLRLQRGDTAVQQLVKTRVPMFEFVIRALLSDYPLDSAESRVQALHRIAPVLAHIQDQALRDIYIRQVVGWVGWTGSINEIERMVAQAARGSGQKAGRTSRVAGSAAGSGSASSASSVEPRLPIPNRGDRSLWAQRETLKLALQYPAVAAPHFDGLGVSAYSHPMYAAIAGAIHAVGGCGVAEPGPTWLQAVMGQLHEAKAQRVGAELVMEPISAIDATGDITAVAAQSFSRLQAQLVDNQIAELNSELSRVSSTDPEQARAIFEDLQALQILRKDLMQRALSGGR